MGVFTCQHLNTETLSIIPEYADPHCKLVGRTVVYKCKNCGEYIKKYYKIENKK